MPDESPYSDPTEATEARLCAYLEGTLGEKDRADIEAYLAKSPEHRKLLDDLATMRAWVSDLPRAVAPPDIADSFDVQIERTMLLDDSNTGMGVRMNRAPQLMLAAAIMLLVAGLGAIIYLALEQRGPTAQKFVSAMKSVKPLPATLPAVPKAGPLPPVLRQEQFAASQNALRGLENEPVTPATQSIQKAPSMMMPKMMAAKPAEPTTRSASAQSAAATTMPIIALSTPATEPATASPTLIAAGDRLSVVIPQLVGPGLEKTTIVRVTPAGQIMLPMLDPMPAAGQTIGALQNQIADRYRQENLIAQPQVTVTRLPAAATTMPTTQTLLAPASQPTTQPSTRPTP